MSKITTFLTFNTHAEDAAKLYVSLFPNSRITNVLRYPAGAPFPPGTAMTVAFELDGQPYTALNGGPTFTFSEGISLAVECQDQAEIDRLWAALIEGGGHEGQCGWLKDRFGVSWQVVPKGLGKLLERPGAVQAMMAMKKLDIAGLQRGA